MGRASNRKKQARRLGRDRPQLLQFLGESRQFLSASCQSYDAGFEAEAKRIAVTLRVMLHDTDRSESLLQQLGIKTSIYWVDSATPINPNNLIQTNNGLVVMQVSFNGEKSVGDYVAPLGDVPPSNQGIYKTFEQWWNIDVMRDSEGGTWSRKQLVTTLANKEGGAHVDPKLTDLYETMATHNGLGWVAGAEGQEQPFGGNAVTAAVRQIAYEVDRTLQMNERKF